MVDKRCHYQEGIHLVGCQCFGPPPMSQAVRELVYHFEAVLPLIEKQYKGLASICREKIKAVTGVSA